MIDYLTVAALPTSLAWGWPDIFDAISGWLGWPYVLATVHVALALVTSAHVVLFKRDVRAAVAWVGVIWLAPPAVGPFLYFIFGINRIQRRASRLQTTGWSPENMFEEGVVRLRGTGGAFEPGRSTRSAPSGAVDTHRLAALRDLVGNVTGRPLTAGNAVTALVNGDEGYPAMLDAIDAARRSIALSTYIFDDDRAGNHFVKALAAAHDRGVAVRVLIDDVGLRYSRPPITGLLRARGVPFATFLKSLLPFRNPYINLRNHRKILVVDGRVGFTGGLNIREGCMLALEPAHPVQDMHFRLQGPVVRHLMEDFALDWGFTTQEVLQGELWRAEPETAGSIEARGIPDGPDEDLDATHWTLLGALAVAEESVRIATPYFIPDQTLISVLSLAAMRGVDVKIVLPERGNLRFVQWASMAQLWQVLINRCEVFLSQAPFDHSKLMVVDDTWALVGSANWDARSLRLNFEYNVECYDRAFAAQIGAIIDAKIAAGRPLSLEAVNSRSLLVKLRDGIVRLAAPYL